MKKKMTLRDIAAEADVSLTTASLYLNGKARQYRIAPETCARLEKAIAKGNYQPNINARAMARKRTDLVGAMLCENILESFWAQIVGGVDEALSKHGIHILLTTSSGDIAEERKSFEYLRSKGVDGILWCPAEKKGGRDNSALARQIDLEIPVVAFVKEIEGLNCAVNDGAIGGALAARHFLERGHRRLAIQGRCVRHADRETSFRMEAEAGGASVTQVDHPWEVLADRSVTGVFCITDTAAMDLYREAAGRGLRIPDDISVIGYDNMPFSGRLSPPLTSVNQQKREFGRAAAEMLLRQLKERAAPEILRLPTSLEVRESVRIISTKGGEI